MSAQPDNPPAGAGSRWLVQPVFDDDGLGGDFAYTIGLHFQGHPELHIYGRPSLGDDPAAASSTRSTTADWSA